MASPDPMTNLQDLTHSTLATGSNRSASCSESWIEWRSGPGRFASSSYTRCGSTKVAGSPRGSPRPQKIVEHQQEPAPQRHVFRRQRLGEPAGDLTEDRVHQRVDAEDVGG